MLLLKQDITKKGQVETAIELDESNSEEYKVEAICNSKVYTKELYNGHLLGFYYLVSWKGYPKKKNTWKPALAMLHLCRLINTFHWDYPKKPIATFLPIDSAPPMARLIVKPRAKASSTKQKRSRLLRDSGTSKRAKKTWTSSFWSCFWPCLNSRQKIPSVI